MYSDVMCMRLYITYFLMTSPSTQEKASLCQIDPKNVGASVGRSDDGLRQTGDIHSNLAGRVCIHPAILPLNFNFSLSQNFSEQGPHAILRTTISMKRKISYSWSPS